MRAGSTETLPALKSLLDHAVSDVVSAHRRLKSVHHRRCLSGALHPGHITRSPCLPSGTSSGKSRETGECNNENGSHWEPPLA